MRTGNLYVISGPSGAGKGTVVSRVLSEVPDSWVSLSATTRKPREGEKDGVQYLFMDRQDFLDLAQEGGFLEWAEYAGNCYGTPKRPVDEHLAAGDHVILEIDVQGAFQIKDIYPDAHLIFIEPPTWEELERRLRGRGTEDEAVIRSRLETARVEMQRKMEYDWSLVNDDLDQAVQSLAGYINEQAETN